MKIRTDFVTNSSSNNTASIVIDNTVLLEILQRYKDMGVFGEALSRYSIGIYKSNYWYLGSPIAWEYPDETKTPAFFMYEAPGGEGWDSTYMSPTTLDEVLPEIISIMDDYHNDPEYYDKDLYTQLKEELDHMVEEIKDGYMKISWKYEDHTNNIEPGGECKWEFTYDPENGEKYIVGFYEGVDDEEDDN